MSDGPDSPSLLVIAEGTVPGGSVSTATREEDAHRPQPEHSLHSGDNDEDTVILTTPENSRNPLQLDLDLLTGSLELVTDTLISASDQDSVKSPVDECLSGSQGMPAFGTPLNPYPTQELYLEIPASPISNGKTAPTDTTPSFADKAVGTTIPTTANTHPREPPSSTPKVKPMGIAMMFRDGEPLLDLVTPGKRNKKGKGKAPMPRYPPNRTGPTRWLGKRAARRRPIVEIDEFESDDAEGPSTSRRRRDDDFVTVE